MSNSIQEILFNDFGLDTDDSQKYMAMGSAPYHLNVLKGEDGVYGEVTNLKGNRKVTYTPPVGHPWLGCNVYFTLCSCYDPLTRNVYYWVFSQPIDTTGSGDYEYDNRLLRFNEDTEVIDTIFVDYLNFMGLDPIKPFKDSFVLGDWLYFNPQTSEPKMIHIEMAYNYTNYDQYDETLTYVYGDYVTYFGGLFMATTAIAVGETPVSEQDKWERVGDAYQSQSLDINTDYEFRYAFNVIKRPPAQRPYCYYGTDTTVNVNNIKKTMFQFAYRYQYFDDSYSLYSALSDVTLPPHTEYINGDVPNDPTIANYIAVNVDLHSAALVKRVEIVFRTMDAFNIWRRCEIIERQDTNLLDIGQQTFIFFNDESYPVALGTDRIEVSHDAVPPMANCQELINKNILCYGGCTEEFENLPKDDIVVNLTAVIEDIEEDEGNLVVRRQNLFKSATFDVPMWDEPVKYYFGDWYPVTEVIYAGATGQPIYNRGLFGIDFRLDWFDDVALAVADRYTVEIEGNKHSYDLEAADIVDAEALANALSEFFADEDMFNLPNNVFHNAVGDYWYIRFSPFLKVTQSIFYDPNGIPLNTVTRHRGFKTGSWHPFCIYYYDQSLRRWSAQVSKENINDFSAAWVVDGTTAYVPTFPEYAPAVADTAHKFNIAWEVNHLPPEGAVYWKWGYAGNSLCGTDFVQYVINDIDTIENATEPLNSYFIDIAPLQTVKTCSSDDGYNQFPNSNIEPYTWQPGDRIRFITKEGTDGVGPGELVDDIFDLEITKQLEDGETHRIYVSASDFNPVTAGIGKWSLVEIYTPLKEDTATIYYEFGELMPIIEDSLGIPCHGGPSGGEDQDTANSTPASGTFSGGDIYHIIRTPSYPINLTEGFFHESASYSDFYNSDYYDRGRYGEEGQWETKYLNIIRYSDQYLQDTRINGLSTFRGGNVVQMSDFYGHILRMIEIGDTLKVYQERKPSSILIGKTQYYDAEGNSNVQAISNRILGSIRYSNTNYGTEFPESISRTNRYVYGFDIYNGVMWRDSANGIFPISGRYESTEGGGNYLMETWFKQKAKAMLLSGVVNSSVNTVWDERHKNLYVVFKDNVDADNNAAVMFHEPSNRWICFTNMGYTPAEGWNQILELTYSVLWGFSSGVDIEFDEDTRFTLFNVGAGLGSTGEVRAFPQIATLTLSAHNAVVSTSKSNTMDLNSLTLTANSPVVKVGYVRADVDTFTWDSDESELGNAETFTLSIGDWPTTMLYFPPWLVVRGNDGVIIGNGATVEDGDVITIYPANDNITADDKVDIITFRDTKLNQETITVTHSASPTGLSVTLYEDDDFIISNPTYTANIGSAFFVVGFDHDLTGAYVWKAFRVYDASGNTLYYGTGNPYGVLLTEGVTSAKTVTLNRAIVAGDQISVQIGTIT